MHKKAVFICSFFLTESFHPKISAYCFKYLFLSLAISLSPSLSAETNSSYPISNKLSTSSNNPNQNSAKPLISSSADVEFLYWTARLDTLSFAQTGVGQQNPNFNDFLVNPSSGHNHTVNWESTPAFRVKIGNFFAHRNWELNLNYLWFYTKAKKGLAFSSPQVTPTANLLAPAHPNSISRSTKSNANWYLHYQVAALELKRNYSTANFFKISPLFSILGMWQKQKYRVTYENLILNPPVQDLSVFSSLTRFKHFSWGIGPRIGFDTTWQFIPYMGVYSTLALSGLWCHYQTRRTDSLDITLPDPEEDDFASSSANLKETIKTVKTFIDVAAGVFFDSSVKWTHYKLLLQVGWEAHIWPNQTLYIQLYDHLSRFDLILHGLTAKIRLEF